MVTQQVEYQGLRDEIERSLFWVRMEVRARAATPLRLEPFNGSLFRSIVGHRLLGRMCLEPARATCTDCPLAPSCPFPPLMETRSWRPATGRRDPPPPGVVLQPPMGLPARVEPGTRLEFAVVLIGRRADVATQTAVQRALWALEEPDGLGDDRGGIRIEEIEAIPLGGRPDISPTAARVVCSLATPTSLKRGRERLRALTAPALLDGARRRLSELARFHGHSPLELPADSSFGPPPEMADGAFEWVNYPRYSRNQGKWMPLEGMVGRFSLVGPLGAWAAIIEATAALNLGGKPLFGFGRLRLDGLE